MNDIGNYIAWLFCIIIMVYGFVIMDEMLNRENYLWGGISAITAMYFYNLSIHFYKK